MRVAKVDEARLVGDDLRHRIQVLPQVLVQRHGHHLCAGLPTVLQQLVIGGVGGDDLPALAPDHEAQCAQEFPGTRARDDLLRRDALATGEQRNQRVFVLGRKVTAGALDGARDGFTRRRWRAVRVFVPVQQIGVVRRWGCTGTAWAGFVGSEGAARAGKQQGGGCK